MASDTETPAAAAPEPMELSTPFKEDQAGVANAQTITPTPTPRKRGRPPKVKTEADASASVSVKTPVKTHTKTPTKSNGKGKGNGKAKVKDDTTSSAANLADDNADEDIESEASPSKKSRTTAPSGTGTGTCAGSATKKAMGPIPTSFEAAGESDRLVLRMRDEGNCGWPEINTAWTKLTGISVGKTTLRMRYCTMKRNFVCVDVEDEPRLLQAKREVEERFEIDKWAKIAEALEASGGKKYPGVTLQKKFKQMASKTGSATTTNTTNITTPATAVPTSATPKANIKAKTSADAGPSASEPTTGTDTAKTSGTGPDPAENTIVTHLDGVNIYDEEA